MKKILTLTSVLALAACGQDVMQYQETGLLCEDATHNSAKAEITLDVKANDEIAKVVVNGEKMTLTVAEEQQDKPMLNYYGTNANNEKVKLVISFADDGTVDMYRLGVNSDETTYGCAKQKQE